MNIGMNIGVFDSGRGGEFIAQGLRKLLPQHLFTVVNDHAHVPYGLRTGAEIIQLTTQAIQPLIDAGCPIIVIACNTATMMAIEALRKAFPAVTFIGTDPMIKPAARDTQAGHITVLATTATLHSARYQQLVRDYAGTITIDQPDTADWASIIERGDTERLSFDAITSSITSGSDTIVLACTHYIVLKKRLQAAFPGVAVLEPTEAIARQITRVS